MGHVLLPFGTVEASQTGWQREVLGEAGSGSLGSKHGHGRLGGMRITDSSATTLIPTLPRGAEGFVFRQAFSFAII